MATVAEIDLELRMRTEKVREDLDISYGKENTIQELLQELSSEYEFNTETLDVVLLDQNSSDEDYTIEKDHYTKTLNELQLEDGDVLLINEATKSDSSRKIEQGKVHFLNATDNEWKVQLYPNQDRVTSVAGKTITVKGPSIPIAGGASLGKFKYAKDSTPIILGDVEEMETSITIKPHQIRSVPYSNYMEKRKPLPVRIEFRDESTKFEETKTMENGEAVILTGDGILEGKTSKNLFTRRTKLTWMLKHPPSHNKNLSFDPHKILIPGIKCKVCRM